MSQVRVSSDQGDDSHGDKGNVRQVFHGFGYTLSNAGAEVHQILKLCSVAAPTLPDDFPLHCSDCSTLTCVCISCCTPLRHLLSPAAWLQM